MDMIEPEGKPGGWAEFKRALRQLFNRYPAAELSSLFTFSFTFHSIADAVNPWSYHASPYRDHVIELAWRSLWFSAVFYLVFKRWRK